jgi:hypothetical protein
VHPGVKHPEAQAGLDTWTTEIRTYLKGNILPGDSASADRITNGILMWYISREEGCELLTEVHGGECGNYASSRKLIGKAF